MQGHDTTAAALSFIFYNVAAHPQVQDQLVEEMAHVFGDSDRPVTSQDLQNLKYTERVIKESLRLYPSVPLFARAVKEDLQVTGQDMQLAVYGQTSPKFTCNMAKEFPLLRLRPIHHIPSALGGHVIPAGANVTISCFQMGRDPKIWQDPEKFDPDRFLPENSAGRHPYAYVPFSAGPRNCIGKPYDAFKDF